MGEWDKATGISGATCRDVKRRIFVMFHVEHLTFLKAIVNRCKLFAAKEFEGGRFRLGVVISRKLLAANVRVSKGFAVAET